MSRPIEFSPEEARARITDVFSANGYNGTSLSMLMDASGLGKQSLYNAFGDKKQMYLSAIDCAAASFASVLPQMNRAASGMIALQVFFDFLVDRCVDDSAAVSNCIVSNGLLNNLEDGALQAHHAARWANTHALLKKTIERGHADGSIGKHIPAAGGADVLMSLMSGFRVNARALLNRTASDGAAVDAPAAASASNGTGTGAASKRAARARLNKSVKIGLSLFKPGAGT
jgi:TetR/AcrR family transcriptional regulator, transcriptional repressor for nem operon